MKIPIIKQCSNCGLPSILIGVVEKDKDNLYINYSCMTCNNGDIITKHKPYKGEVNLGFTYK